MTIGDFATTVVEGTFRLAYLVYNTIENLTNQDDQVACFVNVGRHLEPGGCFVIEVAVPPLRRLPPGETALAFRVTPERLGFDTIDVAQQLGVSHHYWVGEGRAGTFAMPYRYVWPAELDLMARLAGCACASGGAAGGASRSPATAPCTCRCGRSRRRGEDGLGSSF